MLLLLLQRELQVLSVSWKQIVSGAVMNSVLLTLSAAYFMPHMGLPEAGIVPLFLGSFVMSCISVGYNGAIDAAYDIRSPRLTAYYATLPVPFASVVCAQVCVLMLRIAIIALPVLVGGLCLVNRWQVFAVAPLGAVLIFFLSILFNALLFLVLAYWCSIPVLLDSVWPRFISPLFCFGCVFYPWGAFAEKAPGISKIMLLSPLTYCIEGLRSALLGDALFIKWQYCAVLLILFAGVLAGLLWRAMLKALNPVQMTRKMAWK